VAGALVAVAVNRDDVSEDEDYILKVGSLTRGSTNERTNEAVWLVNVPDEAKLFALGEDPEDSYAVEWLFVEDVRQCPPVPASFPAPAAVPGPAAPPRPAPPVPVATPVPVLPAGEALDSSWKLPGEHDRVIEPWSDGEEPAGSSDDEGSQAESEEGSSPEEDSSDDDSKPQNGVSPRKGISAH